jgi:hypothetical protein
LRNAGYEISQCKRKLVEPLFGWMKTVGLMRKLRDRGRKVGWTFTFTAAVQPAAGPFFPSLESRNRSNEAPGWRSSAAC